MSFYNASSVPRTLLKDCFDQEQFDGLINISILYEEEDFWSNVEQMDGPQLDGLGNFHRVGQKNGSAVIEQKMYVQK